MGKRTERTYSIPEVLSELDPTLLRRLVGRHPGSRKKLMTGRGRPVDLEVLALALFNPPDDDSLRGLVRDVAMLEELATDRCRELLLKYVQQFHIVSLDQPTNADLAVLLLLERDDLFQRAYAERLILEHTSFVSYFPVGGALPTIVNHPARIVAHLVRAFDQSLVINRRCPGARVYVFGEGPDFEIVISKAESKRRVSAIAAGTGAREQLVYHPEGFDTLIYRGESGELLTHTKLKSDLDMYFRVIGEQVFGDSELYSSREIEARFTLGPLAKHGAESLACEGTPEIREVRLTALSWNRKPVSTLATRHTSTTNLLLEMERAGEEIPRDVTLSSATFRMEFMDGRESSVRITLPNKANLSQDADHGVVTGWLTQRGFMLNPKEAARELAHAGVEAP